jgi:hypothetical protein
MRVRAGVAPRVASGDPAASKGKSAGGARPSREELSKNTGAQPPRSMLDARTRGGGIILKSSPLRRFRSRRAEMPVAQFM